MRDMECSNLPVTVYWTQKAGHPQAVLSEEGYHKRLVQGTMDVGSEEGTEGVSWEGDMLGEAWACVAALRDERRIDL